MKGWAPLAVAALLAVLVGTAWAAEPVQISRYEAFEPANRGAGIALTRECSRSRVPATLVIRGRGHRLRAHTASVCGGNWRKVGRAPGVRVELYPREDGTTIVLLPGYGTYHRSYSFRLRPGKRSYSGRVVIRHQEAREQMIFEGSDAFVNYCINTGQEIRSSGGLLFCYRIIGEHGFLKLRAPRLH